MYKNLFCSGEYKPLVLICRGKMYPFRLWLLQQWDINSRRITPINWTTYILWILKDKGGENGHSRKMIGQLTVICEPCTSGVINHIGSQKKVLGDWAGVLTWININFACYWIMIEGTSYQESGPDTYLDAYKYQFSKWDIRRYLAWTVTENISDRCTEKSKGVKIRSIVIEQDLGLFIPG